MVETEQGALVNHDDYYDYDDDDDGDDEDGGDDNCGGDDDGDDGDACLSRQS